jgi:hypothetical protein
MCLLTLFLSFMLCLLCSPGRTFFDITSKPTPFKAGTITNSVLNIPCGGTGELLIPMDSAV